jgi:hypothetical protein
VLATVSEYIGIILNELKGRPLFLVRGEYRGGARSTPVVSPWPSDELEAAA